MPSDFTPGTATLIGMAWGDKMAEREFAAEKDRLRQEIQERQAQALGNQALADAAVAVLNTVVTELHQNKDGEAVTEMRLSDPENTRGRNQAFVDTANGQLRRLSENKAAFSIVDMRLLVNTPEEISASLQSKRKRPKAKFK